MLKKSAQSEMIAELENLGPQAIALAYMYAKNMYMYGIDVTEKLQSAVPMDAALHKAYIAGLQAGLDRTRRKEQTHDN